MKTRHPLASEYQKLANKRNYLVKKVVAFLLVHEKVYIQDENLKKWIKADVQKGTAFSIQERMKSKLNGV
jgi:hypothetical protein